MSRWKERGGTGEDVSLARFNSTAGNVAWRRRGTKNSCHTLGESLWEQTSEHFTQSRMRKGWNECKFQKQTIRFGGLAGEGDGW